MRRHTLQVAPEATIPADGSASQDTSDRPVIVRDDTSGAPNARSDTSGGFR
jgi:hypothetical protein